MVPSKSWWLNVVNAVCSESVVVAASLLITSWNDEHREAHNLSGHEADYPLPDSPVFP